MPNDYGNDPEKLLDWNKKLGEQSEFVKKAIEPLLTWKFAYTKECMDTGNSAGNDDYKKFWITKGIEDPKFVKDQLKKFSVDDLYGYLSGYSYDNEFAVRHFKSIGIEGERHSDEITVYNKEELKQDEDEYDLEKIMVWHKHLGDQSEYVKKIIEPLFSWEMAYNNEYPKTEKLKNFWETKGKENPNFVKEYILKELYPADLCDELSRLRELGCINNKMRDFEYLKSLGIEDVIEDDPEQTKTSEQQPVSDRHLETAKKTGYVQGVCESVLAFNTDENRKIMSEAAITFLSKKLLSEMNVTKDIAQKFANPETYKALEQCVFAPKQEQQLEQTQSRGRSM